MQIRDLEIKTGLDRATIRFYEKEALITPQRKENGYREYSEENLNDLLKIKLLRQLGMSLDTIRGIQKGSSDFSKALSEQIRNLEQQIKATVRAKEVCTALYDAKISYEALDASYYLNMLSQQSSKPTKPQFRESVQRPYHPVRRYLARLTDYVLIEIILEFFVVVILRIRPFDGIVSNLIAYGTPFLAVPIHAWMLSRWGTTPGKWLYDLSVLSEDGCMLSFSEATEREWQVLKDGYGFGIPIWSLWRMARSYRTYQDYEPDWDWNVEYQYGAWERGRKGALAATVALLASLVLWCVSDAIKPKYQGDVTVSEFAANYNFYYGLMNEQVSSEDRMSPDGAWYPEYNNSATLYIDGEPLNDRQTFEFETVKSYVQTIRYSNTWTDVWMFQPVTSKCKTVAITAMMTQKGMGLKDLFQFAADMDEADLLDDGKIAFENIEVQWDIETVNCIRMGDQYLMSEDEDKESRVSVIFEIRIFN